MTPAIALTVLETVSYYSTALFAGALGIFLTGCLAVWFYNIVRDA